MSCFDLDSKASFEWLDVRSSQYNEQGEIGAEQVVFPWEDSRFDLAVATSLFTHLEPGEARNYLSETYRVLQPDGLLYSTWFVLGEEAEKLITTVGTYPEFPVRTEWGRLRDAPMPAYGACHSIDFLERVILRPGGHGPPPE